MAAPPCLHSLPSLISNRLNLPFGAQGRFWRLKLIPCQQETGTQKSSCAREPHGVLSVPESHALWPQHHVFEVHLHCNVCQSLLWPSDIPSCGCTAFTHTHPLGGI